MYFHRTRYKIIWFDIISLNSVIGFFVSPIVGEVVLVLLVEESLVLRNFILNPACLINECYVTYIISNFAI